MRVIAGSAKGRRLRVPPSGTRPTSDRVRESLFSSLDHQLGSWDGLAVLDLFAGSAALALEAMSRGAARAVAVESHRGAAAVARANAREAGLRCEVAQSDVRRFLAAEPPRAFDVVFADPPYELPEGQVVDALELLAARGWLADGAVVAVERAARTAPAPWPEGYEGLKDRRFGDTIVRLAVWYRRGDGVAQAPPPSDGGPAESHPGA